MLETGDTTSPENTSCDSIGPPFCKCQKSTVCWILSTFLLVGIVALLVVVNITRAASLPHASVAPRSRAIKIGSLYQEFHHIEAISVQHLLQERGYETQVIVDHDYPHLFNGLFDGSYDLIPSVWLPSGHSLYLKGKVLNKDYEIVGTTSTDALFFFMASPASGIKSIEDLADPEKTVGMNKEIYLSAGSQTGLTIGTKKIIKEINEKRVKADPDAFLFTFTDPYDEKAEARLFEMLERINNNPSSTEKVVVSWYAPWWGDAKYIGQGVFQKLDNGKLGLDNFGVPNRGVTVASRSFIRSGAIDPATWNALQSLFVGAKAISAIDLIAKNNDKTTGEEFLDVYRDYVKQNAELKYFVDNAISSSETFTPSRL